MARRANARSNAGLAAPRLPHHETDSPLPAQRLREPLLQMGQLLLPGHKQRVGRLGLLLGHDGRT